MVVSGLARGIDAHAHKATLGVGRTVAVLGHGLAHTSPRFNKGLRSDILENGGAIVSSWPDDVPPRPRFFPIRNRWISGLSDRVVVVEAPMRSGALITAGFAAEQGRGLAAVPGRIGSSESQGCLLLIERGAEMIVDVDRFVADRTASVAPERDEWLLRLSPARRSRRSPASLAARWRSCWPI